MNKDLTVGKPTTVLWKFCLPLFGSIIFQQLYNLADSFVAGKFIGEDALAAVGNSYEITLIFIAFAFGCNIGCSVIVSRYFGAKNYSDVKTSVYTTWIAGGALCAVLMIFGLLFARPLLGLINTPASVMNDSALYLDIYIWGLPFVFFYNISTGIFTALGDSKTPFFFLAASSVSNIAVDILFVAVFKMGVAGVAWATFICQGISCVLAVVFIILRLKKINAENKPKLFSVKIFKELAVIAIPSILQQSFISVGNIIIQGVINSFETSVMAGYSAAVKMNNLVITSLTTVGNGISNFTSQNIGAGKEERVKEGWKSGLLIALVLCVPFVILYFAAGKYIMLIFMKNKATDALRYGMEFLRTVAPFYIIISVKLMTDGVLRGAGMMGKFTIATFTDLIIRVVFSKIVSGYWGTMGIWSAWPVGWCIATLLSLLFFMTSPFGKRKNSPKNKEV